MSIGISAALGGELEAARAEIEKLYGMLGRKDAEIVRLRAENERLASALRWEQNQAERIGTHSDTCWGWGPQHYECLLRRCDEMRKELDEAYFALGYDDGGEVS